ncbi:reverse transcriptase domain-containing protein [Tanacetum coccineum]
MPSHVKMYNESEDPEDHLKIFQAAAKVERWAMPTWCHMFNSTLTGNARVWFDDLLLESIDSYDDLKEAFLANYLQQKKCIKDPIKIHHIKQREGESTEDFVRRFKIESMDVKGAPEQQDAGHGQNFKKGGFKNQQRSEKRQDKFALLTKTPKEILALDKGKFKPPPPMTTPVEKRNASKFCEFHGEVGYTTDECMHLKRQIEEMLKAGKLSHLTKELKQNNGKDQAKVTKKGEAAGKDKPLAILIVQSGRKIAKQRITQTFSPEIMISFPPLREEDETEGPMVNEAEVGGYLVHCIYVDGGASSEILYEHCFNQLRPEIRSQMVPATTYLVGFSGEIIWPLGQVSLLVKIGNEEHSTSTWMNFMIVRSHSPYNGIIGRPSVRRIKAIPSTTHGMLKFLVTGGTVTLRSSRIIPLECAMILGPRTQQPVVDQVTEEKIQKPADMTGVPRHIAEHRLNVREGFFPIRQKKRGQAPERNKAICEEVEKLVNAAAKETISAVLMTKKDGKQIPIYFVSRALRGLEINYTPMEKLVLALVTRRLLKWSFKLEKHDIQYRPRTPVKGQILADFIVERLEDNLEDTLMEDAEELPDPWILFTDRSSYADGSRAGLILTNLEGMEFTYALRFRFDATNNEVEYEALIAGLKIAEQMGVENLQANVDSRLVANQVNGTYVAKETDMIRYLEKIASTSFAYLSKQVLVEELKEKSISAMEVLAVVEEEGDTWMTPIFKYLLDRTLPAEGKKARAVKRKSWRFSIINEILYKKSFLEPWLRCVGPLQANYVLREIHEGSCSMHAGIRSIMEKALRIGYYWPTMHEDARKLIQACQDAKFTSLSQGTLNNNEAQSHLRSRSTSGVLTLPDLFQKDPKRFGLPGEIISDNGKQVQDNPFKDCLGEGIKARLDERSKNWMEELPHVLWAHRTMIKSSNGDTPFSLTYGTEAVIPTEIGMPTLRTTEVNLEENKEALEINLDLLEERREQAAIREAKSKTKMERCYNSKV